MKNLAGEVSNAATKLWFETLASRTRSDERCPAARQPFHHDPPFPFRQDRRRIERILR
jgi:hypothetical protein